MTEGMRAAVSKELEVVYYYRTLEDNDDLEPGWYIETIQGQRRPECYDSRADAVASISGKKGSTRASSR